MLMIFLSSRAAHTLPDLPYDYNALEPVIIIQIFMIMDRQLIQSSHSFAKVISAGSISAGKANGTLSTENTASAAIVRFCSMIIDY